SATVGLSLRLGVTRISFPRHPGAQWAAHGTGARGLWRGGGHAAGNWGRAVRSGPQVERFEAHRAHDFWPCRSCTMVQPGQLLNLSCMAGDCGPLLGSCRSCQLPLPSRELAELFGLATMLFNGDAIV